MFNPCLSLGVSDFATKQHDPESGRTHFRGTWDELLTLTLNSWERRKPGFGRNDLDKVVVVPVPPDNFSDLRFTPLNDNLVLEAYTDRRREEEDPFVTSRATGVKRFLTHEVTPEEAAVVMRQGVYYDTDKDGSLRHYTIDPIAPVRPSYAKVVCYSKEALLENNGTCSTDCDWEIVCLIASDVEDEPMHPLAMARNFLEKTGGTFAPYTAKQFAEAVYYWSQRVAIKRD